MVLDNYNRKSSNLLARKDKLPQKKPKALNSQNPPSLLFLSYSRKNFLDNHSLSSKYFDTISTNKSISVFYPYNNLLTPPNWVHQLPRYQDSCNANLLDPLNIAIVK
ncbi:hypothetical protein BD560DRAFT_425569 [Blakeslea trispora]|nr:hypothetical protein BD560DRAFT_425569 [Blakeslea trispora]